MNRGKALYIRIRNKLLRRSLVSDFRSRSHKKHRLLFVFTGLHGFWLGMGRGLYCSEPIFRETILQCENILDGEFPIADYFEEKIDISQFAGRELEYYTFLLQVVVQLGISALWRSKGVEAHAALGCSLGIFTSGLINDSMTLEEVLVLVNNYGRWIESYSREGKLLAVPFGSEKMIEFFKDCPVDVSISVEHGPSETVVFCLEKNLPQVCSFLDQKVVRYTVYPGEYVCHTPLFEANRQIDPFHTEIIPAPPAGRFYSSLGGTSYPPGAAMDASFCYWQAAKPCLFNSAFEQALSDGFDVFVIVGSNLVLQHHMTEAAAKMQKDVLILNSIRNDEAEKTTFSRALEALTKLDFVGSPEAVTKPNFEPRDDFEDPYSHFASVRKAGAVHFLEQDKSYLVLDYEDVAEALRQPDIFGTVPEQTLDSSVLRDNELTGHPWVRQALLSQFSARGLADMRDYIEQNAFSLLNEQIQKNEFEVISALSTPLAELVMARILGLSKESQSSIQHVSAQHNRFTQPYITAVENYFSTYFRGESGASENVFLCRLLAADSANELAIEHKINLFKLFWLAGTTPTSILITSAIHILLHHHAVRYELQKNLELIPQFIEEVLRFASPEQTVLRIALQETQIAGVLIPAGAQVKLSLGAANRDAKHYRRADLFLLTRNPKDHLAFGAGSHYCLGAVLARMEAQIAVKTLLSMCENIRAVQPAHLDRYVPTDRYRALEQLLVRIN